MDFSSSSSAYQKFHDSDRKINNAFTAQKQAQDFEMSNVTVVPDGECHRQCCSFKYRNVPSQPDNSFLDFKRSVLILLFFSF